MHIKDIAKKLNIAPSTVSRALNPDTQHMISEAQRERIKKLALAVNYRPNRNARALSTGRTHTIGVILPTTFDSFFFNDHMNKVLASVYKVLSEDKRYNLKLIVIPKGNTLFDIEKEILDNRVDGLLLSSCSDHHFSSSHYFPKKLLSKWNQPIVVMGLNLKRTRFSSIYSSNFEAAERVTTYLIRKGHRRIAMIDQIPPVPDSIERVKGYKSVLRQHNIAVDPSLLIGGKWVREEEEVHHPAMRGLPGHNMFPVERAYTCTLNLFKGAGPKPTAIFCANDETAFGALRALQVLGVKCPGDGAVMGFDGLDATELSTPRLSTVNQPTLEMALHGTKLLLDLIDGTKKGPVHKFVPMDLVIRESA